MEDIVIERNKSITYFLPLFNKFVSISYNNLLRNTYLWYDSIKDESFCLLYEFDGRVRGQNSNRNGFTIYEDRILFKNKLFRGYHDYGKYVIYKFELPDELLDVRDTLIQGKYSKLSKEDKYLITNYILKYYGPRESQHINKILTKDAGLRLELADKLGYRDLPPEYELSSPFSIEKELFLNSVIK